MKNIILLLGLLAGVTMAQIQPAPGTRQTGPGGGNSYSGDLVNLPGGLTYNSQYTIDMSQYKASKATAQVLFSTITFTNYTFTDGSESASTITVASNSGLAAAQATDNVTVISTTGLTGACLTVYNYNLCYGNQWNKGATVHATAVNLAAAIATVPSLSAVAGGGTSGVVYATATAGSYANSYQFISNNTSVTVNAGYMSGGADNAVLTIGGVPLTQGSQWSVGNVSSNTAASIATAINTAFTTLTSTNNNSGHGTIIFATSTLNGSQYNYTLVSSTPTAMSVNSQAFHGGTSPNFALNGLLITSTTVNSFPVGLPVLYTSGTLAIGGLSNQTTYYAYPVNSSLELVKYATSAVAGSPASDFVTFTSTNSGLTAHTYTLAPLAWSVGSASFIWQSSNDNSDWFTSYYTGNVSTGTVTIYSTTTAQDLPVDFGVYNYRYLRLNFTGPATGAVDLVVPVNIKQDGIGPF